MKTAAILDICSKIAPAFSASARDIPYESRGILNSEALLIAALAKHYGVSRILESGRARGYSTHLLARFFADTPVRIISIDCEQNEDTRFSESVLADYPNVELVYGDSNALLPLHANEPCMVFIDGPKDEDALDLAVSMLRNDQVRAVLVHDLSKDKFSRDIAELIFNQIFFTDNKEYVETFSNLDEQCWKTYKGSDFAPFLIKGKRSLSYGPTVGAIFNSDQPFKEPSFSNYMDYRKKNQPTVRKALSRTLGKNSTIVKILRSFKANFSQIASKKDHR